LTPEEISELPRTPQKTKKTTNHNAAPGPKRQKLSLNNHFAAITDTIGIDATLSQKQETWESIIQFCKSTIAKTMTVKKHNENNQKVYMECNRYILNAKPAIDAAIRMNTGKCVDKSREAIKSELTVNINKIEKRLASLGALSSSM
jgi:hypothetical protein